MKSQMKIFSHVLMLLGFLFLASCDENDVQIKEPRLACYIESYEIPGLGFQPQLKIVYQYDGSGRVERYTVSGYDPATELMTEQRYFDFSYTSGKVLGIKGYLPGKSSPYVEYVYVYLTDGNVSRIFEHNYATGINSEVEFLYSQNDTIHVSYTFSNGGFFEYEFDYATGNIMADRTTKGTQICSEGEYTYDQKKNPFSELGYVDYLLTNLSRNNKLTENVSYTACAFPTLIPESYSYEYNDDGYPVTATTLYKSGGSLTMSKKEFFYTAVSVH